ncbi:protein serrate-like [Mytilus edulis]|uniref:protein serrate-like n=1 Tax=Mytilus edulis TaxID=6550 RepID=UPI0039F05769
MEAHVRHLLPVSHALVQQVTPEPPVRVNVVDHCKPDPCLHSGWCVSTTNGYTCQCTSRYTGKNCQTFVTTSTTQSPTTATPTSWIKVTQPTSWKKITLLTTSTTQSPTTATPTSWIKVTQPTSWKKITLPTSWLKVTVPTIAPTTASPFITVAHTVAPTDPCKPDPCKHSGWCIQNGSDYTCQCLSRYSGKSCELLGEHPSVV